MPAPQPINCDVDGCGWSTPNRIPFWELILKSYELHVSAKHGAWPGGNPTASADMKLEKLPMPTFSLNMSEGDWAFTLQQWDPTSLR